MRLDPAKRMQTVPELMSALTDPNVANAMFERGDNQISTRKIMGVSLVVIFVLVVLLLWSLLGGSKDGTRPTSTPQAVTSTAAGEQHRKATVPNLVGLRYATDIKGNTAYDGYRIVMVEQSSDTVAQGVVISQDPPAGTEKLMDDQIIQITVSSGPNLVEMPDIIGFTQANASKSWTPWASSTRWSWWTTTARWRPGVWPRRITWPGRRSTPRMSRSLSASPVSGMTRWWRRLAGARKQ